MTILILVMAHNTDDENFTVFKNLWDLTIKNATEKKIPIDIKYLYSDELQVESYKVVENKIISNCPENYWYSLLIKFLNGVDFFLKEDYTFVFKTNLSTIVNLEIFYNYCLNIDKNRNFIYDGVVDTYENYLFCSGAGFLLNRASAKLILDNLNLVSDKWTDDIFVGFVLNKKHGVIPNGRGLKREDILSINTPIDVLKVKNASHIRIKIRQFDYDSVVAKKIYNILN